MLFCTPDHSDELDEMLSLAVFMELDPDELDCVPEVVLVELREVVDAAELTSDAIWDVVVEVVPKVEPVEVADANEAATSLTRRPSTSSRVVTAFDSGCWFGLAISGAIVIATPEEKRFANEMKLLLYLSGELRCSCARVFCRFGMCL